jgi:protein-tyrosine phosphatase
MLTFLQDIAKLFQELEWRQRFRLQHAMNNPESSPFRIERSALVFSRNRYGNVQPWDRSRIRLKVPIGGSDYVNASPISLRSRSTPSTPNTQSGASVNQQSTSSNLDLPDSKYIATQGPKDGQFSHFWNMVMQETVGDVGVIVMLTQCWEGNKEKCGQYFPSNLDTPVLDLEKREGSDQPSNVTGDPFLDSDPLSGDADSDTAEAPGSEGSSLETHGESHRQGRVMLLESHHDPNSRSEVRKLKVQIGGETKMIWHYLFNGWPDYAKPEGEDRQALLELIKQSAAKAGNPGLNPRFIHCSAGVGRTGTFIALDYLLRELAHGKLEVIPSSSRPSSSGQHTQSSRDGSEAGSANGSLVMGKESTPEAKEDFIFETVNMLREQRMMMVMNDVQFSFLYEVLREAYVEMYSPSHLKVVGSVAGPIRDEAEDVGERTVDADMGEPSPKMARTGDMLFVGPSETVQEESTQAEPKAMNADAVTANSTVAPGAEEGVLYSTLGTGTGREEGPPKMD